MEEYPQRCINRNILECKERVNVTIFKVHVVLIETYWNVKKPDSEPKLDSESNINRNILECKVRKNTKSTTH